MDLRWFDERTIPKMSEYRFRIAGFTLALRLPYGWDVDTLLPSFRAFRIDAHDSSELLLVCAVRPLRGEYSAESSDMLLEETVNDMGRVRLYAGSGEYRVTLCARPGGAVHVMRASSDFSGVEVLLCPEDRDAGYILSSLLRIAYSQAILYHDALSIHASAVCCEGRACLFMGKSGTGKSTHSALWTRYVPGTELLNDDNPTIRILEDAAYAYGTPWSGKTPCYRPLSFPVGGMVRLKQASANRFRRQEGANAFVAIYPGCSVIGQDAGLRSHLYDTLVCLAEMVPVGVLECLPDREAALLCHRELLMAES